MPIVQRAKLLSGLPFQLLPALHAGVGVGWSLALAQTQ
jgi:hypothetical protein